jgi:coenzyme F420-reducing hydrogenase beta subunit
MINPDLLNIMKRFCVACGACLSACPSNAIMPITIHGIATIKIDPRKCSNCNFCVKVCPIFDYLKDVTYITNRQSFRQFFIGYACDEQIRNNAAAGGLVTALSSYLLEKGEIDGVLTVKMQGIGPFPFIAEDLSELKDAQGSIYFPTYGLKSTKLLKDTKRKMAIVGLPCQINAIEKLIRNNIMRRENVEYLFGLRCYHIHSPWYLDYIVNCMLQTPMNKINQITSRKHGWQGGINVKSESGTYFVPLVFSWKRGVGVYNPMGLEHLNAQPGCIICKERDNINADITFAEAWFTIGKSLIIARTEKGSELINRAASEGKIVIESVKEENLPHLMEGRESAYKFQQQIVSDIVKHGFASNNQKHGLLSIPVVLPHMIFNSPFFRQVLLQTIPPKILMSAIGAYMRALNEYFLHRRNV